MANIRRSALAYIRVSTEEQSKGFSLDAQADCIEGYCAKQNIDIVHSFREEGRSAKTFTHRPEWTKLLAFAEKHHKSVDLILVTKYDRFSRNFYEACAMLMRLQSLDIEVRAIEQEVDTDVPENSMLQAIYLVQPQIENRRRAKNTQSGMHRALREGVYMGSTPYGFTSGRDHRGKRYLSVDPEIGPKLLKAFEQFAKGLYTVEDVRRKLKLHGVKISRSQFYNVLRNPVYAGQVRLPAIDDEEQKLIEGNIERLVSLELWGKVQKLLDKQKRLYQLNRDNDRGPILRSHLRCQKCKRSITSSTSIGHGGRYTYYHCPSGCVRVRDSVLTGYFDEFLKSVSLELKDHVRTTVSEFNRSWQSTEKNRKIELNIITKDIKELQRTRTNATETYVRKKITRTAYEQLLESVDNRRKDLEIKSIELSITNDALPIQIAFAGDIITDLPKIYGEASDEVRSQLLGSIFRDRLAFDGQSFRTSQDDSIIGLFRSKTAILSPKTERVTAQNGSHSYQAASPGFEPGTH
jgi:site-specific DNA recombinase